jgi:hypothetical protein
MLAEYRRHDGLIVDAGVRHQHAKGFEGGNRAPLELDHPGLLLELVRGGKVGAARVADSGNAQAAAVRRLRCCQPFQPLDPGRSERFGIGHDVRLGHGDEIGGTEISPTLI